MNKDKIAEILGKELNSIEYSISISSNLINIIEQISSDIVFVDNSKNRVLNLFFLNIQNNFKSLFLLISEKLFSEVYIIARRIFELYIRTKYISDNQVYENYFREKYIEQAKLLNQLIQHHDIRHICKNPLWEKREEIIRECKLIREDIKIGKYKNTPIKAMAIESSLAYLYNTSYSTLSKFVHGNMSTEYFYLYAENGDKRYAIDDLSITFNEDSVKKVINDINICVYKFLTIYCKELDTKTDIIKDFASNNPIFISFDMTTGLLKSNVDVSLELVNNLFGESIQRQDDDSIYEKTFIIDDIELDWTKLERSIKDRERELNIGR